MVTIITGGSNGIGLATAQLFAEKGHVVYDFSRHGTTNDGCKHIDCDVTNPADVQRAVGEVVRQEGRIDCLICNAGYGIAGAVEFTVLDDAKRQLDVNFFGALTLVQAVVPIMRQQSGGTVLFTSSVAAVFSIPYQAFYSVSKSAVNALAMALRSELLPFDIRVSALMLGDVHTGFTAARKTNLQGAEIYRNMQHAIAVMEQDEQNGMTPQYVALHVYRVALKRNPAPLYTIGLSYRLFVFLDRLLPKRLSHWIVAKMYS